MKGKSLVEAGEETTIYYHNVLEAKLAFDAIDNIGIIVFGLPGEEEEGTVTIDDYPDLVGIKFIDYFKEQYKIPVILLTLVIESADRTLQRECPCRTIECG